MFSSFHASGLIAWEDISGDIGPAISRAAILSGREGAMVHCHKCGTVNPPEREICLRCGTNLLPGEGISDRVGNLIAGVIAAAILIYRRSRQRKYSV